MKQNNFNVIAERRKKTKASRGKSKYARKVAAGNQMYGPGCCAHRINIGYRKEEQHHAS